MTKKVVSILLVFVLVGMVLAGCTTESEDEETKETYKIGAILSVTGPAAPLGEPEKKTLEMMEDKVNDAGGIDGHKIEIIIEDDETDPSKAVAAANKLIKVDKVLAIIGCSTSTSTMAVKPITLKEKVPHVALAASDAVTADDNTWIFRTPQKDTVAVGKVLEYVSETLGAKNIAVLHDSNEFGQNGADTIAEIAPDMDMTVVATEKYETKATDVTTQLTNINVTGPDAVIVWGTNPTPANAAKNMQQLGMTVPYVGSHGIANMTFIELAGDAANGVVLPAGKIALPGDIDEDDDQFDPINDFIADYEDEYDEAPNTFAGHAWDAFEIVTIALEKSGADRSKLRDEIENTEDFAGTGGVFTYTSDDHDGLDIDDMFIIMIEDGKWTLGAK